MVVWKYAESPFGQHLAILREMLSHSNMQSTQYFFSFNIRDNMNFCANIKAKLHIVNYWVVGYKLSVDIFPSNF